MFLTCSNHRVLSPGYWIRLACSLAKGLWSLPPRPLGKDSRQEVATLRNSLERARGRAVSMDVKDRAGWQNGSWSTERVSDGSVQRRKRVEKLETDVVAGAVMGERIKLIGSGAADLTPRRAPQASLRQQGCRCRSGRSNGFQHRQQKV